MSFLKTLASLFGVTDAEPTEAAVEAAARMVVQDAQSMKEAMSTMAQTVKADGVTPAGLVKAVQSVAARAERPDVSKYVPVETFNAVNAELGQMKAAQSVVRSARHWSRGRRSPPPAIPKRSRASLRRLPTCGPARARPCSPSRPRRPARAAGSTARPRRCAGRWAFPRKPTKKPCRA